MTDTRDINYIRFNFSLVIYIGPDLMPRDHKLFEFAALVHLFYSNWTKLAYSNRLNMDKTSVFDENLSCDQKSLLKTNQFKNLKILRSYYFPPILVSDIPYV